MANKPEIRIIHPGDDTEVGWNEEYDRIEYGYRTPDGLEHFAGAWSMSYTTDKTDLRTHKGQEFAQAKFQKAVEQTGVKYDAEKHGRLEFILRVRQIRFTGVVPLFPNTEES